MAQFQRIVGAAADVNELEYCSALHQTTLADTTRRNGTVSSRDVQRLLVSRYGLVQLRHAQCVRAVQSLGGGDGGGEDDGSRRVVMMRTRGRKRSKSSGKTTESEGRFNRIFMGKKNSKGQNIKATSNEEGGEESFSNWSGGGGVHGEEVVRETELNKIVDRPEEIADAHGPETIGEDDANVVAASCSEIPSPSEEDSVHTDDAQISATATDLSENQGQPVEGQPETDAIASLEESKDGISQHDVEEEITTENHSSAASVAQEEESTLSVVITDSGLHPEHDPEDTATSMAAAGAGDIAWEAGGMKGKTGNHIMDDNEIPEQYLDLIQILALLLIPTFVRAVAAQTSTSPGNSTDDEASTNTPVDQAEDPYQSLDPQPVHLIQDGLRYLLKNVYIDEDDTLSVDLVEALLLEFGEYERAQNPQLLQEMVQMATTDSGRLDATALAQALTTDVRDYWRVGCEDGPSTYAEDVFGGEDPVQAQKRTDPQSGLGGRAFEMNAIDYVVDQHTSLLVVGVTWTFFFMMSITYGALIQSLVNVQCEVEGRGKEFGCQLISVLWTWMVFAVVLILFGYVVILPLSLGNNPTHRTPFRMVACSVLACLYSVVPYGTTIQYIRDSEEPFDEPEQRANREFFEPLLHLTVIVGLLLALLFLIQVVKMLCSECYSSGRLKSFMTTSNTNGEWRSKQAGTRKINRLLLNAQSLHSDDALRPFASSSSARTNKTAVDQTMLNFVLRGKQTEVAGGLLWTWKRLWSGNLFDTEGIWLPTRLLVFQAGQVAAGIAIIFIVFTFTELAASEAKSFQADLDPTLPDWAKDIVPKPEAVYAALYPASAVTTLVVINLILLYIPSATSTILLWRCGQTPSLGSRSFNKYRKNVDAAYTNTGNAIYGLLGASLLFYFLVGLFIFLFSYEATRGFMLRVLAWGLGLAITIITKMLLVKTCQRTMHKAFYRTRPRAANFSTLTLECWFLGLGSSVLIGRITQFLCAAVFWVGRIDVPFLSENVALMGYAFDYVPTSFAKDLLQHEAHRHPYLERLAQMYILKLRHPTFNSNAGAVWRQLFVLAMMPWMRKHRVFSDERALQAVEALAQYKLEVEDDNMGLAERFGDDVQALVPNAATHVVSAGAASAEAGVRFVASTAADAGQIVTRGATPTSSPSTKLVIENSKHVEV